MLDTHTLAFTPEEIRVCLRIIWETLETDKASDENGKILNEGGTYVAQLIMDKLRGTGVKELGRHGEIT